MPHLTFRNALPAPQVTHGNWRVPAFVYLPQVARQTSVKWKLSMSRGGEDNGRVVVLLSGPAERLAVDTFAFLSQEFPRLEGAGFERAVSTLSARLPAQKTAAVLSDFAVLMSTMAAAGRLPRLRPGRPKAGKDELFVIALLAAVQRDDNGRAIEAAIALLDTGRVHAVVSAAKSLGKRLADMGIVLGSIYEPTFQYVAGYPSVEGVLSRSKPVTEPDRPKRPVLRLLRSA